jgi:tRNA modification GTPase
VSTTGAPPRLAGADTIAAIATASGVGGVGIVRLSGPDAISIVASMLGISPSDLTREVRVGWARDLHDTQVDQVLAFAMRAPASFTGEDVAELHGHGGSHNLRRLLDAVRERGARIAEPGEFTRRAVTNGKLDLARAEALLDVIHAGSERAWRLAQANLGGRLGAVASELEASAVAVLAEIEGRIDFPEDDIAPADAAEIDRALSTLSTRCASLADGFRHGRALSHGITVALVGPVNVGKSSLLNALVGTERALVAPVPGTTRDYLEVHDLWDGVRVTLLDTAGTRDTADAIEARGIELGERRVESADVVVVVNDGDHPWDDGVRFGARALVIVSKSDRGRTQLAQLSSEASEGRTQLRQLSSEASKGRTELVRPSSGPAAVLATSAVTGAGLDELKRRVLTLAGVAECEGAEDAFVTTARQQEMAASARDSFTAALTAFRGGGVPEVVALEIRQGLAALAQLRGVEVGDRVLDEVFARFCIGK